MSDRPGIASAEHDALRARVLALAAGLLSDAEASDVRAHLATCRECDELSRDLADPPESASDGAHLPAEMLSHWPVAAATLRGFEREMVRRHLVRCGECREDLQVLGFAPQLPDDLAERAAEVAPVTASSHASPAPIRLPRHSRDVRAWILGGWATLATAAAILLVLNPESTRLPMTPGAPTVPAPPRSPDRSPQPPATSGADVVEIPKPITLRSPLRGQGESIPSGHADPTGRYLSVSLPAQGFAIGEAERVTLEVARHGGDALVRREEPASSFARARTLLLSSGEARWTPGRYLLRLVIHPGPNALLMEPETREFAFDVVAAR